MDGVLGGRDVVVLDGGLATHLEALGADLGGELWSARLLVEDPALVRRAHRDYFVAGADVAITASYQASVPALLRRGMDRAAAARLLRLSVELAARARAEAGGGLVAASVGPYGAALANGAEYTGAYDLDEDGLHAWHRERWHVLAAAGADLLACETIPSAAEARALARLLAETPEVPAWVSFSCRDGERVADGTPLADCLAPLVALPNVVAAGVNCTAPRHVSELVRRVRGVPAVAYPNSGERWDTAAGGWRGRADAADFAAAARDWHAAGARLVGGCCRTTPEHIRRVRAALTGRPSREFPDDGPDATRSFA